MPYLKSLSLIQRMMKNIQHFLLSILFFLPFFDMNGADTIKVEISFPTQIDLNSITLVFDNGLKTEQLKIIDKKDHKINIQENCYSKYGSISIYHAEGAFEFFVSKQSLISFGLDEQGKLKLNKLINVWSHEQKGKDELILFLSEAQNNFDEFYAKHGDAWMNNDSLMNIAVSLADNIEDMKGEFVKSHGQLYYAFYLFRKEIVFDPHLSYDSLMIIFTTSFSSELTNSQEGKRILKIIDGRKKKKGKITPSFLAKDIAGNEISPSQFLGKYLIINFWSSACGPCLAEMPKMKSIRETWSETELVFMFISSDREVEQFQKTVSKHEFEFGHHLFVTPEIKRKYASYTLPQLFIVDPKGMVIYNIEEDDDYSLETFTELIEKLSAKN